VDDRDAGPGVLSPDARFFSRRSSRGRKASEQVPWTTASL